MIFRSPRYLDILISSRLGTNKRREENETIYFLMKMIEERERERDEDDGDNGNDSERSKENIA